MRGEGGAALTDEEAAELRELGENLKRAVAEGDSLRYSELDREVHRRVGEISGQRVAVGLLERLHAQLVRHQFQLALRPGRPRSRWPSTWPSSTRSPTGGRTRPTSPSALTWPASSARCGDTETG